MVLTKNPNKFYPRLEIHLISKKLLVQIKEFLIKNKINAKLYQCKRKKKELRWKNLQEQYRIQINGKKNLIAFRDLVGFINPKHQRIFEEFIRYSQEYDLVNKTDLKLKSKINKNFIKVMAAPRVELGTSSS